MRKKGLTLSIVVIAISLMLILVTSASVIGSGAISTANFEKYNSMISRMSNDVNQYFIQNKELPVTSEIVDSISLGSEFSKSMQINGDMDDKLLVVDIKKIEDSTIDRGRGTIANRDVFLITKNSHNVYYLKGYKYKKDLVFTQKKYDYSSEVENIYIKYLSVVNNNLNIAVSRGVNLVKYAKGEFDVNYFATNGVVCINNSIKIDDLGQIYTVYAKNSENKEIVSRVSLPFTKEYINTSTGISGSYQTFVVPSNGKYKIEAYGAAGSNGNKGSKSVAPLGGKGAYVFGEFDLTKGETLILLCGQMGMLSIPSNSSDDGTSGGSGGATFVTKVTNDTKYNLTAQGQNKYVTPLLIASGGNGGNDFGISKILVNGADGICESATLNSGFTSFLTSPNGVEFTNISQTASGGFGGGCAIDDMNSIGGGSTLGSATSTNNTGSYSYIYSATNFGGKTGANPYNGKIAITKTSLDKID